jgi:hypothetical protein
MATKRSASIINAIMLTAAVVDIANGGGAGMIWPVLVAAGRVGALVST